MSEAPERVWAWPSADDRGWYAAECSYEVNLGLWGSPLCDLQTEYIRADIHEARIKELEQQVKDERRCLAAWFDTRKLAHDAIDAAVLDAAKGYLRMSRSGGMRQQESDIVAGVIKDMARLSVFADLFARAKMPLPSAPKERKENET